MGRFSKASLSRREWLRLSAAGVVSYSLSGWLEALANDTAKNPQRRRSCILLWMNGGPSQMDTFDLKPGHANGGPFKEIATSVPGIKISEHLPKIARFADRMAIVRSMNTKEGEHGRAAYYMRTGYLPQGPIQYPPMGATVSHELGDLRSELPNFVSIAPFKLLAPTAFGPGFLGPQHAPLIVGEQDYIFEQQDRRESYDQALKVKDLQAPAKVTRPQMEARIDLLHEMQKDFAERHGGPSPRSHQSAYERAVRLMRTAGARAFNLDEEPSKLRDAYGRNLFGQGCLLARRLVERGVPFVEVSLTEIDGFDFGWDSHAGNFEAVAKLSAVLDPAWATLMSDLQARGLLDSTLIVWMGEFGRTPKINSTRGRDHFPDAWSTVLAGGGIKGGQMVGKTSKDGMTVEERPVSVPDLLATVYRALGINPLKKNMSNVGRPIYIAEKDARPIQEVLA